MTGIETLAYIDTRLRAVLAALPVDQGLHSWPRPPTAFFADGAAVTVTECERAVRMTDRGNGSK